MNDIYIYTYITNKLEKIQKVEVKENIHFKYCSFKLNLVIKKENE